MVEQKPVEWTRMVDIRGGCIVGSGEGTGLGLHLVRGLTTKLAALEH